MEVRIEKTETFYKTTVKWWESHGFPAVHISFLPVNIFIVSNNGDDLYSCFFYHTDSALGWLAYPLSNAEIPKEKRVGALEFLFLEIEKYAKENGYYLTFTTSPVAPVQNTLLDIGYVEGDIKVNQYFKQLV